MHPLPVAVLAVVALLVATAAAALRRDRARAAEREAAERDAAEARRAAAAAAAPAAPFDAARERVARGECRFCGERAEHRKPAVVHARPLFDGLLRRFGIVPVVQPQLRLDALSLDAPVELCRACRERARALVEVKISEWPAEYARFIDVRTRDLNSFMQTELYARMEADQQADSKRTPRARRAAAATAPVSLP